MDIVMSLRSRMSQCGNYVSNWVQDYASVVLCPIPTGFQIGIWIPIGSIAITRDGRVGSKKARIGRRGRCAGRRSRRCDANRALAVQRFGEVRRLQAHVPAFGAGAARCGPSCSVLGGVPRAELLCCCAGLLVPSWAECPGRNYCAAVHHVSRVCTA